MKYSQDNFEAAKFLGNAVGRNNPFLRKIACMSTEMREIRAFLEIVKVWDPPVKSDPEYKKLCETIELWGQGQFQMDIVSHLSMKANVDESVFSGH